MMSKMEMKRYKFQYKDILVGYLDVKYHTIVSVAIENPEYLPIGTFSCRGFSEELFRRWWKNNSIPASRASIQAALEAVGVDDAEEIKILGHGLSLTNHYWIQPVEEDVLWRDVNYFENVFSDELGKALFHHKPLREKRICDSPDNSLNGMLNKRWSVIDGRRYLVKSASGYNGYEPYNEVLAYRLFREIDAPAVRYDLYQEEAGVCSICECFTDNDRELVPAADVIETYTEDGRRDLYSYENMMDICQRLKISNAEEIFSKMIFVDYLIHNMDRHVNNFGFLYHRANNSFCLAPMYDSGTSMFCDSQIRGREPDEDFLMRPFAGYGFQSKASEMIRLIHGKYFSWGFDFSEIIHAYIDSLKTAGELTDERLQFLQRSLEMRCDLLRHQIQS